MNPTDHTNNTLDTRKAIITGGSSGIGRSVTHKLSKAGFITVVADIQEPEDKQSHFFQVDLKQPDEIDGFYKKVIAAVGIPDVLVLNAGQGIHEKLTEGDPNLWEQIFQLNVFSALRLVRAFVPQMIRQERGDIIFTSSVASRQAFPYGGIYGATKAAIDMIAETLRLEVQPAVRVTTLHPGVVDSGFFNNMIHGSQTAESIGWGALSPDQVADAVLFAINQPAGVAVNDMVIRPVAQPL